MTSPTDRTSAEVRAFFSLLFDEWLPAPRTLPGTYQVLYKYLLNPQIQKSGFQRLRGKHLVLKAPQLSLLQPAVSSPQPEKARLRPRTPAQKGQRGNTDPQPGNRRQHCCNVEDGASRNEHLMLTSSMIFKCLFPPPLTGER